MRCNASPTTSTADNARTVATRTVEAIVFREILKPLTANLGALADIATEPIADRLAGLPKR